MHQIIDADWFPLVSFILLGFFTIVIGFWFEFRPKNNRLDNKTDDFIKLKNWETRKDGMK